jgi:serine/threonine-protein kinase RsbW
VSHPRTVSRLTLPARPESINAIHEMVATFWNQNPWLGTAERNPFELGVIEIAGNIIEHARPTRPDAPHLNIDVTLTATSHQVTARLCDNGAATDIDISGARMPDEMAEHGRGLALTQGLLHDLTYERSGSANIWTLTCKLSADETTRR